MKYNHYTKRKIKIIRLTIVSILIAIVVLGCSTLPERISGNRDYLVGWYDLPSRDHDTHEIIQGPGTLIPVFKIDGTYYSVCRGFEVPLKECAEGLEWASIPSSMTGTTIGCDKASNKVYIRIVDQGLAGVDDRYIAGEKRVMKKVDKPLWFPNLNAKTKSPRSNDDFLGRYQCLWLPIAKMTVRKEVDRYKLVMHMQEWGHDDEIIGLKPLPDRLGFTLLDNEVTLSLTYNKALKRVEVIPTKQMFPSERMPLVKVMPESSFQRDTASIPTIKIGIPSWH